MSSNRLRPGCRHFSRAALESVCDADAFDYLSRGEFRRRSDHRDLLAALLLAEGKELQGLTAGGTFAARALGFDVDDHGRGRAVRELNELGWLADAGGCRTPELLRQVLLGADTIAPPAPRALPHWDDAVFSEGAAEMVTPIDTTRCVVCQRPFNGPSKPV